MTGLAEACADLAGLIPVARDLITQPDTDGTTGGGKPGSSPPWNPAAAAAYLDAHAGLRDLEAVMHLAVTGRARAERGGSDANTLKAIAAIEALGDVSGGARAAEAARIIGQWATQILQLPAVDEAERWTRPNAACPYCQVPNSLRVAVRSGRVTCIRYGVCVDSDGNHPVGQMAVGQVTARAAVHWADGLVAP